MYIALLSFVSTSFLTSCNSSEGESTSAKLNVYSRTQWIIVASDFDSSKSPRILHPAQSPELLVSCIQQWKEDNGGQIQGRRLVNNEIQRGAV
ncbi:hypothetical protein B0H15DRAFT_272807 [Mycena belliarum]|uniref:Uncharacterized protein n=1 Tax=Mycena belliarum TaxID=1033014 RepID=A0AAD6XV50_9AGAR|nr:hypothetical protein B0H15DRAFT_272807 [Mycena belliae]